jgi:hypothetical protein
MLYQLSYDPNHAVRRFDGAGRIGNYSGQDQALLARLLLFLLFRIPRQKTPRLDLILKLQSARLAKMKSLLSALPLSNCLKSFLAALAALAACALLGCGGDAVEIQTDVSIEDSSDEPPPPLTNSTDSTEGRLSLEESARLMAPKGQDLIEAPSAGMDGGTAGLSFTETLRKKAENGNHASAQILGRKLITGDGVEKDLKEGLKWVKLAANHNNAKAQAQLGRLYEDGNGVPQNAPLAYAWYLIGAKQDDPDAIERIGILGEKLSDLDLEEAERLAADFVSK